MESKRPSTRGRDARFKKEEIDQALRFWNVGSFRKGGELVDFSDRKPEGPFFQQLRTFTPHVGDEKEASYVTDPRSLRELLLSEDAVPTGSFSASEEAFKIFDTEDAHVLSADVIRECLQRCYPEELGTLTPDDMAVLMRAIDVNKDGAVDYADYQHLHSSKLEIDVVHAFEFMRDLERAPPEREPHPPTSRPHPLTRERSERLAAAERDRAHMGPSPPPPQQRGSGPVRVRTIAGERASRTRLVEPVAPLPPLAPPPAAALPERTEASAANGADNGSVSGGGGSGEGSEGEGRALRREDLARTPRSATDIKITKGRTHELRKRK